MRQLATLALIATLALSGCPSRQQRGSFESAEAGLVLLDREGDRPLTEELEALYSAASRQLGALPEHTKGWLGGLGTALDRLRVRSLALASQNPERLQQALAPYRSLGRYPIGYEEVKVPLDAELAPVVVAANRQLHQAWRVNGALWLAAGIEPLLRQETYHLNDRDEAARTALGSAAVSQLYLLLQAAQASEGLAAELEESQRLAGLRLSVLRARLNANPGQSRILGDDIQLLAALIESLLRARTELYEASRRLETLSIQAGDRVEAISRSLS